MAKKRKGIRAEDAVSISGREQSAARLENSAASYKTEAQESPQTNQEILSSAVSIQEKVALLAYSYWQQRGCQGGSPEEDWFRAEREILGRLSISEP